MLQIGLISAFLFISNFVFKIFPRITKNIWSTDTFTELYIIKLIKKNRNLPEYSPAHLIDRYHNAPFATPFLTHLILSVFSLKCLEKHEKLIGPFISSLTIVVIYAFTSLWLSPGLAFGIALISIIAPINFWDDLFLTARPFGFLFVNLAILSLITFYLSRSPLFLAVAVITGTGVFLLHKFSTQAFLVSLLAILIATGFELKTLMIPLIILIILFWPLRKFYIKRILNNHFNVLKWHWRNMKKGLRKYATPVTFKSLIKNFANNPFFALLAVFIIQNPDFFLDNKIYRIMLLWALIPEIAACLTKYVKNLGFLGEGRRYRGYNIFPIAFLVIAFWGQNQNPLNTALLITVVIFSLLSIGRIFKTGVLGQKNILNDDLKKICRRLKSLPKENVWPIGYGVAPAVMYLTEKNVPIALHGASLLKEPPPLPLRVRFYDTINRFKINYLLIDKRRPDIKDIYLGDYKKIAEEGNYRLLEIIPKNNE